MKNFRSVSIILIAITLFVTATGCQSNASTLKVGILHSLSGTMAISESALVDAELMAIEEINNAGGIEGRKIEPIVVDGKSDWAFFASEAERLITEEKVITIFGCWTSACRKTLKPIIEQYNSLLIYPVQYEGLETSSNIVYTGAAPNQQIIPAVKWAFDEIGDKVFLVGSDYVFPRAANAIIRDQVTAMRGEIVGEEYILLGSQNVNDIIQKIIDANPDVILNTINGDSNVAFFKALRDAGISSNRIPTISFSIAEEELLQMNPDDMAGDYAVWNYFQSIPSAQNTEFVQKFKAKYGADRVTDDPIEAAYFGVYLWAQAVAQAEGEDTVAIRDAIKDQSFNAPGGVVYVDSDTLHTWKSVHVGKIRIDGQFDIIWSSENPIRPEPFPIYRSQAEWEKFLNTLYTGWGGNWANPGP